MIDIINRFISENKFNEEFQNELNTHIQLMHDDTAGFEDDTTDYSKINTVQDIISEIYLQTYTDIDEQDLIDDIQSFNSFYEWNKEDIKDF